MSPALLALLVCPTSRGPLTFDAAASELVSEKAGLAFPIREGVPHLLLRDGRPIRSRP
jgi:hypothetical protein